MERLNSIKLERINIKNVKDKEIRKYILIHNACINSIEKNKIEYQRYAEGSKYDSQFYDKSGLNFYKTKIITSLNQIERLKRKILL